MTNPPIPTPVPAQTLQPANWQVSCVVLTASGQLAACKGMAEYLNNGWQFMGIQTGNQGLDSFAYFCRNRNK